jgi:hypothetical protein
MQNEMPNANICGADTKGEVQPCWTKLWDVLRDHNTKNNTDLFVLEG